MTPTLLAGLVASLGISAPAAAPGTAETVVISEFMAANARSVRDNFGAYEDWIELQNISDRPVNLSGWTLATHPRKATGWTLPATNLAPGACLLVWASGRDLHEPGRPLHASFRLARGGDYLALRHPNGTVATEFAPQYPPQWPDASYGFLPGATQAVVFVAPTPGQPNTTTRVRPGPWIESVTATPNPPGPGESVQVIAELAAAAAPITQVGLRWRSGFGKEATLAMEPIPGDARRWSARLPPALSSTHRPLRWRVEARDQEGGLSEYPPATDPRRTSRYLGLVARDEPLRSALPVLQVFAPEAPGSRRGEPADFDEGVGCVVADGEFYDNVVFTIRGNSTASFPKRSHRLEFPVDHPFRPPGSDRRIRHTSMLAEWGDPTYLRQHLSFWLMNQAGTPAPFHDPIRVELNGDFWQLAMHSEVLGREMLERMGLDPRGALYKAVGTLTPDQNSTGGFEKKTRRQEGEEDYLEFAAGLAETRGLDARRRTLFRAVNLPATINYLAVARVTQEDDDIWANLSLYHDNEGTGEWRPVPFDMNVSWGFSFSHGGIQADRDDVRSHPFFGARDTGWLQGFNRLYDAVIQVPDTRAMLLRRMRTLLDRWWRPPGTPMEQRPLERHLFDMVGQIAPEAALDRARWGSPWTIRHGLPPEQALGAGVTDLVRSFIEPRRRHLFVTHQASQATRRFPVGITSHHNAGIPAAQAADVRVVLAPGPSAIPGSLVLTNETAEAVDLSGWTLSGRREFTFAPGTVLSPHLDLTVVRDLREHRRNGAPGGGPRGLFVVGDLRGDPASTEPLVLRDDHGREVTRQDAP